MSPTFIEAIGLSAGLLTTVSFIPQARHAWRTRSTKDLSLAMYLAFTLGVLLWLIYGIMISSLAVVVANAVTLALSLFILILKMSHG